MGCGSNQLFGMFTWREPGNEATSISLSGLIKTGYGYNKLVLVSEFYHQEVIKRW